MSKLPIIVSATIVLIFSCSVGLAAPERSVPKSDVSPSVWPENKTDENLSVSQPPAPNGKPPPPDARYYAYRQALTFRAGMASDFPDVEFKDVVLGFQYLFPKFLSPKLEAGADLYEEGRGHLHVGMRWFMWERSYFRPSGKIGLDHRAESEERLATLTKIDNYYVRLSGTLEYVVWNPFSLRLEHELLINFDNTQTALTLGLSRGW